MPQSKAKQREVQGIKPLHPSPCERKKESKRETKPLEPELASTQYVSHRGVEMRLGLGVVGTVVFGDGLPTQKPRAYRAASAVVTRHPKSRPLNNTKQGPAGQVPAGHACPRSPAERKKRDSGGRGT